MQLACTPSVVGNGNNDTTGTTGTSGDGSAPTDDAPIPTGGDTIDSSSSSGTSASESSSSGGQDTHGAGEPCDYVLQDCASGLKCVRIDPDGDFKDETVCVPVDPDPRGSGEPCMLDEQTGVDDCSQTAFCATPPLGGAGYCTDFCLPRYDAWACDDPTKICVGSASQGEYGCFAMCDPLVDDCPPSQRCMPSWDSFACVPLAPEGDATTGAPCYGPIEGCPAGHDCYQCAQGHTCIDGLDYGPGCALDELGGCCTEYCDLAQGACSNPLHECLPLEVPLESHADLGACGVPDDFEWCDGPFEPPIGVCPPPDAEPNIPWCSPLDTDDCPVDAVVVDGGQCGYCWCRDACETVDDCPVPQTGTSIPTCDDDGDCVLVCEDDGDCPNGMDCRFFSGSYLCLWQDENCP